ncbi:MAG: HD-GYP domain-containing protein [Desulfotomaculales bacterium]
MEGSHIILVEARILGVADVVEAMASHRPYRPAQGVARALAEIAQNAGVLYDPDVVRACLEPAWNFSGKAGSVSTSRLLLFALVLVFFQAVFLDRGQVLFYIIPWVGDLPVTDEGLVPGAARGLRMMAVVTGALLAARAVGYGT